MTLKVEPAQPPRAGESLPRYAPRLTLPAMPFLPGSGHRRPAPYAPPTEERAWPELPLHRDRAFREGVDLYHYGCWWEAHERWEAPWRRSSRPDPAYPLLRGMILLAASHLKHVVAQPAGASRLLERSQAQLGLALGRMQDRLTADARTDLAGIEVARLLAAVGAWGGAGFRRGVARERSRPARGHAGGTPPDRAAGLNGAVVGKSVPHGTRSPA